MKNKMATRTTIRPAPADQAQRRETLETRESFLVQAPAGSGKTELLVRRFLKLLGQVEEPEHILAITFTLAATAEMRARVVKALHRASDPEEDGEEVELARAALANDRRRGWNILQQPQRLNLQTIDSVCLAIAHETPLLSRLGGSLSPTDKPEAMYALAARRTLARLGGEVELSGALRALLQWRGTKLQECQSLIAEMLGKRDQWGQLLQFGATIDWVRIRATLEGPLAREHQRVLTRVQEQFAQHEELAAALIAHLRDASMDPHPDLACLHQVKHLDDLTEHQQWSCLCELLLTKDAGWRQRMQHGFKVLLPHLAPHDHLREMLAEVRHLPPVRYSEAEWEMLRNMLVVLRYATAELRLVFAEMRKVDFVELGLAAREVLVDEDGNPSLVAGDIARQWRHLLVDEFQDTSRSQYELLSMLTSGWEQGEHTSCFLVGDPMQSIYMFRQAEVELFERTRLYGLGEGKTAVALSLLQLRVNFRSHAGLVDRLNQIFASVFQQNGQGEQYQVSFVPSVAYSPAVGNLGVRVWPFFDDPQGGVSPMEAEARQVVSIIQSHGSKLAEAEKAGGSYTIAVLVRARPHLARIIPRLREAGIPFRAIEIEPLLERQEVRDLTGLTHALLHPMNRIAWLSVLRAPWCGLTLRDLHILCGQDRKEFSAQPVIRLMRERIDLLSPDGQKRAGRVQRVLETALNGRHRQSSLARWVERTWISLGGRACIDAGQYENVRTYFSMLEELGPDAAGLEKRLEDLCAQPDPRASERCGVQLMTIHKAKGLGFDVVIVPGLERRSRAEKQEMLRWLQQTRVGGETEREEHEFVAAPIGRNGRQGEIYQWVGRQLGRKENDEAKRLLYVAATRARSELHLMATVELRKNGQELARPWSGTLLRVAWGALEVDFQRAFAERAPVEPVEVEPQAQLPFPPMIALRRLPADWESPVGEDAAVVKEGPVAAERRQGSLATRAFGTTVHALLEDLAGNGEADVAGWRSRAAALLRSAGIPRAEAQSQAAEVVKTLQAVLKDDTGRWILGARAEAQSEASWSSWVESDGGERVQTLRGDRIFRAGAEPGSVERTHLWIVDYKTARHGGSGLEEFLEAEKVAYLPQLEAYAAIVRKVRGETGIIRLGLYYPLLGRLLWW